MKIAGLSADKADKLLHILKRWDRYVTFHFDDADWTYTITISNEVPYLFHYNHPFATFELGCNIIKIENNEFVEITII